MVIRSETSTANTSITLNNNKKIKITRIIELFLLFWIDEADSGRKMFAESAQTRMHNIKSDKNFRESIHKVHCPPIQTLTEIQTVIDNWIESYGGTSKVKVREVGIFSHSGLDGPITFHTPNHPPLNERAVQMHFDGWTAINFNWATHAGAFKTRYAFYGCNSANLVNSFAERISKQSNTSGVIVCGQTASSFPSFFPDYRVTSMARSTPIAGGFG